MKFLDKIFGAFKKKKRKRGFGAAEVSRLMASLASETEYINNTLRWELKTLRARSRQAAQNNPFARKFAKMVVNNVCGPNPFKFQAKSKKKNGTLDKTANAKIESQWKLWNNRRNCDLTNRNTWSALQRLIVNTLAVDGEALVRIYRGPDYGKFGYQLQIIDTDRLDEMKNESLANGGAIHMGVEVDSINKPVAYHLLKKKPSEWQNYYTREYERVPAGEIIHLFIPEFPEQVRGIPWMYAAMVNLVNIGGFEEAAVIAARIGAAQMGFIQAPDDGQSFDYDGEDTQGNPQITAEPGMFPVLPEGYSVSGWNPKYPDAAIDPFLKACLRGVSSGLDVAYHNLSGDMNGVNYSSARIAELGERDSWMTVQNFVSEHLHQDIYEDWLVMQVLTGNLAFNFAAIDKYKDVYWQGRRWAWVDPLKEVNAKVVALENRLTSRTRVIAETGNDIEEVESEINQEKPIAKDSNSPKVEEDEET